MAIFDFLKNKTEYKCARCKKPVAEGEFKWVGKHRICYDCSTKLTVKPPMSPLGRVKPEDHKSEPPKTCYRCKKEFAETEPVILGKYHFCPECACLPEGTGLTENGARFKFHYPVSDLHAEDKYWNDAVDRADKRRISKEAPVRPEKVKCVEAIMVRTTEDIEYPTDYNFDWDVMIMVCADEQTGEHYFSLEENYLSMWDAFPVYNGGMITLSEAEEYLHRIGNHKYDNVLKNK